MVPRWVRGACIGEPWPVVLYACLADHADRDSDNGWTIGRQGLADEIGAGIRTIDKAVKHLEGIGALEVTRQKRGNENIWSRYVIHMADPGGGAKSAPGGAESALGGAKNDTLPIEPPTKTQAARDEEFEDFWSKYPQKPGASKKRTRIAWNRAKVDHTMMMVALTAWVWFWDRERERTHWARPDEFIPLPTTWLNQGRWENPPKVPPKREYRDKNEEFLASQQWRVIHGGA
jgi:hypothetical protein